MVGGCLSSRSVSLGSAEVELGVGRPRRAPTELSSPLDVLACILSDLATTARGDSLLNRSSPPLHRPSPRSRPPDKPIYARHSPRTASLRQLDAFLLDYASVYHPLWANRLRRCWGQSRFRVYGLMRKTLDRFFHGMRGDRGEPPPVVAYGAANFAPTGRGERAVPTTALAKACARHFKVTMIDEFRTSQMCHACCSRFQAVAKRSADGTIHEMRGLRRCGSTECARVSFKGRDCNAALNVLRRFRDTQRPTYLSRNPKLQKSELCRRRGSNPRALSCMGGRRDWLSLLNPTP